MFDWDDHNIDHCAAHGVTMEEAEEALTDSRRIGVSAYDTEEEERWAVVGATISGRVLLVVFTRRPGLVRVITARNASAMQKRRYRRR